ncbi:hypothetical protein HanXRQr2_Chr16g0772641 [Helianthus annuus]|uniref:Uncharacterized protein n=1 Tax=Helianthus annuus TaxID=4232 RepID=A0A9K3DUW0_HELAN|nr:hypothetical protein HanXRQr2_Chr16g0772641 [Helianthus annuus]
MKKKSTYNFPQTVFAFFHLNLQFLDRIPVLTASCNGNRCRILVTTLSGMVLIISSGANSDASSAIILTRRQILMININRWNISHDTHKPSINRKTELLFMVCIIM